MQQFNSLTVDIKKTKYVIKSASVFFYVLGLSKPAIAVDPCKELLDFASKLEGVRTRVGTCEEFIDSPDEEIDQYNKFMLCRSYHHIPNLEGVFKKFYNRISRGSKLMIIDQPRYVLPEKLKEKVRPISIYEAEAYLQSAGFTVIKHLEHQSTTWNKQDYFKCLRHRMFSVFKLVSDKDIEEGIAELDRDFFGFKESAVKDTVTTFLTGTK